MPAGGGHPVGTGMPANAMLNSPPSSRARPLPQRPHSTPDTGWTGALDVLPLTLRIEEHRRHDFRLDHAAIRLRRVDTLAHALEAAFDHTHGERVAQGVGRVAGGDVADHVHRDRLFRV